MEDQSSSPTGFLNQLRIIHFAMIAGVTMFLLVSIYISSSGILEVPGDPEFSNILFIATAAMTVLLMPVSYVLFRRRTASIERESNMESLLLLYKSAFIVKMSIIESPAFFSIVVLLLSGNLWLLVQICAVLLVMIINRPTAEKIVTELNLDRDQINEIRNF